ncbi:MAG: hypothetical protein L0387_35290, partial [Acidobacteria bacterium]|nr:hypothetical protein [Acidobacteriota bacterium]
RDGNAISNHGSTAGLPSSGLSLIPGEIRSSEPSLVARGAVGYAVAMKTASVQQVPQQWPDILRWVAAGEEVQVTQQDRVVARVVPAKPVATPDFLARAKAVWGEKPAGKPLSAIVLEARGGEP